ncbi:RING-H2 finger protein ATL79-like [Primulina huaijiensis]|uniref:RING-H2 finger protein ATL79-like n=1 Tax=Primulina huaijiensis TaxID=1492673 RepID=UPI003CC78CF2
MRDAPYSLDEFHSRLSPPAYTAAQPPYPSSKCDVQRCPWWPYSSSKEFKANTALVIVFLTCALICGLAFNSAIRYVIRIHYRRRRGQQSQTSEDGKQELENGAGGAEAEIPVLDYTEGMKLAGEEMECIICLTEFEIGEKLRVLEDCKHGFHVNCIQQWLLLHSSCPTCRTKCSVKSSTPP